MTDTIRTEAELLTLLADNTSGAISAQDLRDLVKTVSLSQARRVTKVFTHADILTWGTGNSFEILPPAPAGKWYRITSGMVKSTIVDPYTNIDGWRILVIGWDDDAWDASQKIVYGYPNPRALDLLSNSAVTTLFSPFTISGTVEDGLVPQGDQITLADILEKNLALATNNGGNRPITSATIAAGGLNYQVGDVLKINSAEIGAGQAQWSVDAVDGSGTVTAITLLSGGRFHTAGSGVATPASFTSAGTGCTLNTTVDTTRTPSAGHADNTLTVVLTYVLEDA